MKYENIITALAAHRWAIHEPALHSIVAMLEERALFGGAPEAAEIEQRLAASKPYGLGAAGISAPGTEVISLHGPIFNRASYFARACGHASPQHFTAAVEAAAADDAVRRIVLDIDSPGGTVGGTAAAAAAVRAAAKKKEVIAVANDTAASAAYWIASQATRLYVLPSSVVGSIGVIATHVDRSDAAREGGLRVTYVRSGARKALGQPYEAMASETVRDWQEEMDGLAGAFYEAVAEGRGMTKEHVAEAFGDGRVLVGHAAVSAGLADEVRTLESILAELSSSPSGRARPAPAARARSGALSNTKTTPTMNEELKDAAEAAEGAVAPEAAQDGPEAAPEADRAVEGNSEAPAASEPAYEQPGALAALRAELEAARAEVEAARSAQVEAVIQAAFAEGRITAAEVDPLKKLAAADLEGTKALLAARSAPPQLAALSGENLRTEARSLNAVERRLKAMREQD